MKVLNDFYEAERIALEAAAGGKNTYLYDDLGYPSVMVKIPLFFLSDIDAQWPNEPHPAFIVNGVQKDCIWISKYMNVLQYNRAYSLADRDPAINVSFDQAVEYCNNKGAGWHLMTNAEWSAVALWSRKNGTVPHGNNWVGQDWAHPHETGAVASIFGPGEGTYKRCWRRTEEGEYYIGRTLTGSGPSTWNHDGTPAGIADLNGNLWEWVSGMRLKGGEIHIIENNNAADGAADHSENSSAWKAVLQDGRLALAGSEGTLKINGTIEGNDMEISEPIGQNTSIIDIVRDKPNYTGGETNATYASSWRHFETLSAAEGVSIPDILKYLCLAPADNDGYNTDTLYTRNYGERLPLRGGHHGHAHLSGIFALLLGYDRNMRGAVAGLRCAYVDPNSDKF